MKILTEIQKLNNEYRLLMAIPGVKKDDVKISVNKSNLTVVAEPKIAGLTDVDKNAIVYSEFSNDFKIYKNFSIDTDSLDVDKFEATVNDGVLTLRLPFKEESKSREVVVTGG